MMKQSQVRAVKACKESGESDINNRPESRFKNKSPAKIKPPATPIKALEIEQYPNKHFLKYQSLFNNWTIFAQNVAGKKPHG